MKKKMIILLLLTVLLMPIGVKADGIWEGNNISQDLTSQGCDTSKTGWCTWNNANFTAAKVTLKFYYSK